MIERLKNSDVEVSKKIHSVFQLSYKVEAEILNATDFPPLKRPLESYINSETVFFGFLKEKELTGVIEIIHNADFTRIKSLVVSPSFFRQGVARKLMEFVFNTYDSELFVVETGLDNGPATTLYKKFNFKEVLQYDTENGIRKIRFERKMHK